jgi:transcriptional regulator with XRE-family HTH domain
LEVSVVKQTLKEWRDERRMSREQLAALSGVSYPTIARLESKADAKPGIDVAINLAKALGVAVEDIEWGKTPKDDPAAA